MSPSERHDNSQNQGEYQQQVLISGRVQGVGFRPFVCRLARQLGIVGQVENQGEQVLLSMQGALTALAEMQSRIRAQLPWPGQLEQMQIVSSQKIPTRTFGNFSAHFAKAAANLKSGFTSQAAGVLIDSAPCAACREELLDPHSRRYRYAFISCCACGPRISILQGLPFDRQQTSLREFPLCTKCQAEHDDEKDRRFLAVTISCADCGPKLKLYQVDPQQSVMKEILQTGSQQQLILRAAEEITAGKIIALKGVGGFQLIGDATNDASVQRLRHLKRRAKQPFAVMFASLSDIQQEAFFNPQEAHSLQAQTRPIVLLKQRPGKLAESISCGLGTLGAMLPSSPLHELLISYLQVPLFCTSGNVSGEPICVSDAEVAERLVSICDLVLTHDRQILQRLDDSVVRIIDNAEVPIRRARGYVPCRLRLPPIVNQPTSDKTAVVLAVGPHLKNTLAVAANGFVQVTGHIGGLTDALTCIYFQEQFAKLLHEHSANLICCDLHPDYFSSLQARRQNEAPLLKVQHHMAHAYALLLEQNIQPAALILSWDGAGLGEDSSGRQDLRGGEFLACNENYQLSRFAHFRAFFIPGGEKNHADNRKIALGLLYEQYGDSLWENAVWKNWLQQTFEKAELQILQKILQEKTLGVYTSSVGRLFDGISALTGVVMRNTFEAEAAQKLESLAATCGNNVEFTLSSQSLDWGVFVLFLEQRLANYWAKRQALTIAEQQKIAWQWHQFLALSAGQVILHSGYKTIGLTGGVFQNRLLTETLIAYLRNHDLHVVQHRYLPPGDGGVSAGQAFAGVLHYVSSRARSNRLDADHKPLNNSTDDFGVC